MPQNWVLKLMVWDSLTDETDPAVESTTPGSSEVTQLATTSGEDVPILWNAVSNYENIRARGITNVEKNKVRLFSVRNHS